MIPNIVHLNFGLTADFANKPFGMVHYMAAKSALEVNNPDRVHMWYGYEPEDSTWWNRLKDIAELHKLKPPTHIHGRALRHAAHRSDILRLQKLKELGGVYIDCDTVCIRPYEDLRKREFVMGLRGDNAGLCNATMLSIPDAPFIDRWLEAYSTFRSRGHDRYYDEHSLHVPMQLSKEYPDLVTILPPTAFFYPLWPAFPNLVNGPDRNVTCDAYSIHLWEKATWPLFKDMTPAQLQDSTSEFARLTRHLVREFA